MSNKPGDPSLSGGDNLDIRMKGDAGYNASSSPAPLELSDTTAEQLADGTKIIRYSKPQKLQKLIGDAKKEIGAQEARFHGKGWVISRGGSGLARIAEDGMTVTYYPPEVAQLVDDLLGPET